MAPHPVFTALYPYLARYRRGYLWGGCALLVGIAFQLATPEALRSAIDALASRDSGGALAARYGLLFFALAVGHALFRFVSRRTFLGIARHIEHDLRRDYFSRLIRLPAHRIESGRKGDLTSRGTHDLLDLRLCLGAGMLNFLQTSVLLLGSATLLWRIHPGLTAVALLPLPIISLLVRWHSPRLHRCYRAANRSAGDLSAAVQETLNGLRIVRTYGREAWQEERFAAHNLQLRQAQSRVIVAWATLYPMVGVLAGLGHVVVLGWGGRLVYHGAITLGQFVAFNTYLAMLTWPMIALGWTLSLVQRGSAALQRIDEVRGQPAAADGTRSVPHTHRSALACRAVTFRHRGATADTLHDLEFSLPDGSCWGLVGATGAGKSTLVELLSRLRRPDHGVILLRGTALESLHSSHLYRELALVPQDGYFFTASVADNVRLGRPENRQRLEWALDAAGLLPEVEAMADRVDTRVGEGGITLSGGQRQRLALARALYGQPRILLLDACFSNLDARTAHQVVHNVRRALPASSLLLVSHRGDELEQTDQVLFLRDGTVAARGSHASLLQQHPAYLALYREEELRRQLREVLP